MRTRPTLLVATLAVILLAVTLGATATSATAQESNTSAVRFSDEWTLLGAVVTNVAIDPDDPTGVMHLEGESSALLFGDFVGLDHTSASFTFDPEAGEAKGDIRETSVGTYAPDGSARTMTREGPFTGNFNTGEFRHNQRITGGTGDFDGSRGHMTGLACRFFVPDDAVTPTDSDHVAEVVAGLNGSGDGRWMLTVDDAAHLMLKKRISAHIDGAVTVDGEDVPLHVATSTRGRRFLRSTGDATSLNDLDRLPPVPA